MSRSLVCLIVCLFTLVACQTPPPPAAPTTFTISPVPDVSGKVWKYWPATAARPLDVYAASRQDKVLWVGTSVGVWRVDPRTREYTAYGSLGRIICVLPVENGRLWAAGENGLFYFDGQQWNRLDLQGWVEYWPWASNIFLGLDLEGNLWLALPGYQPTFFRFVGHTPSPTGLSLAEKGAAIPSLDSDQCETWIAVASPGYSYSSTAECQALAKSRLRGAPRLYSATDQDGSAWWISDDTLQHVTGDKSTTLALQYLGVAAVVSDPTHGVWLGTYQGLLYSDGYVLQPISLGQENYTLHDLPRNLAVDLAGTVWVVTANGVQNLPQGTHTWQTVTDFGLGEYGNKRPFGTIAPAHEGGIWATHGQDVWRFGGPSVMLPVEAPLDKPCRLIRLSVDRAGNVWSPSPGCGALQYIPQTNQWIRHEPEATIDEVMIDSTGAVSLRGAAGVYISSGNPLSRDWQLVTPPEPVQKLDAALTMNIQGGHWVESLETGETQFYRTGPMGSVKPPLQAHTVYRAYVDRIGQIWLGGNSELAMFNGQTWGHIATPSVGPIRDITGDSQGRIFIAGDEGIAIYDPAAEQ